MHQAERPVAPRIEETTIPHSLRTGSGGSLFAALICAVVGLMIVVGYYALQYVLSHGR